MLSHLVTLILISRHDIDMNVMFHSVAMSPIIDVLSALPSHVHVTTRTLVEHVCLSDIGRGSSDSKRDEHFKSLNTWIKAHSYGQASIPLDYLFSPEAKFRARTANLDDVKKLRVSLSTFHSVHNQGRVVFFIPPEMELPDKRGFSPLRFARLLEAGDDGALALARDGGFVIIGDHTQLALKDLRLDFPKNDLWKRMPCEVMFCRREEAAYKNLKSWGILDNVKGQRRAFLSFEAKMLSLRQDFVGLHESGDDPSSQEFRNYVVTLETNRMAEYDMSSNSFGQLWGLVSKSEQVWDLLQKIFTGDVANAKDFKKPRSASNFVHMGNIPDEDLLPMLQPVVSGSKTLKEFTDSCKLWKAVARVQTAILTHINDGTDWEAVQERYPSACSDAFVLIWAKCVLSQSIKLKTPLPADFYAMLRKKCDADQQRARAVEAHASVSVVFEHININVVA
jgi:hypothetical protein